MTLARSLRWRQLARADAMKHRTSELGLEGFGRLHREAEEDLEAALNENEALHGFLMDIAKSLKLVQPVESYDDVCSAVYRLVQA